MNAVNAREFFVAQHESAHKNATKYAKADAENGERTALRALAEYCQGEVDLSSAVFEGGVVIFPDGPTLSVYYGGHGSNGFKVQGICARAN